MGEIFLPVDLIHGHLSLSEFLIMVNLKGKALESLRLPKNFLAFFFFFAYFYTLSLNPVLLNIIGGNALSSQK